MSSWHKDENPYMIDVMRWDDMNPVSRSMHKKMPQPRLGFFSRPWPHTCRARSLSMCHMASQTMPDQSYCNRGFRRGGGMRIKSYLVRDPFWMLASPFWAKFVNIINPAPRGAEGCRGFPGVGMGESRGGGGGYSALNLPGCVSMKVMDMGLFLAPSEWSEWTCFHSKWVSNVSPPLHLCMGVSLNPVHSIWVFSL